MSACLFKGAITWPSALLLLGAVATASAFLAWLVRFSPEAEAYAHAHRTAPVALAAPVVPAASSIEPALNSAS